MKVQFKIKIWDEYEIPREIETEVADAINSGRVHSSHDLFELVEELTGETLNNEYLVETECQLTVDENDNEATIEVYKDGRLVCDNAHEE